MDWIILGAVTLIFFGLGAMFRKGKGAFLIAGYNTMSEKEKAQYDEKALCRSMGKLMYLLGACFAVVTAAAILEIIWLMWTGIGVFLAIITIDIVYSNTGNRFKK